MHRDGTCWIHSGDIGYIREDRNLVIVDRMKRVFIRKGFKVYPVALEEGAMSSGFLMECVVIERKSEDYTEANVPVMYAVLAEDTPM